MHLFWIYNTSLTIIPLILSVHPLFYAVYPSNTVFLNPQCLWNDDKKLLSLHDN